MLACDDLLSCRFEVLPLFATVIEVFLFVLIVHSAVKDIVPILHTKPRILSYAAVVLFRLQIHDIVG